MISPSALSTSLRVSTAIPVSFQISYNPPISSPIERAGGPSIFIIDFPFVLCPVTIPVSYTHLTLPTKRIV